MPGPFIPEVVMVADVPSSRAALAATSSVAASVERASVAPTPAAERAGPLDTPPEPADGAGLLLSAGVGTHVGAPHPYAALTLLARLGVRLGHWEVQGYAQWDVTHVALEDDAAYARLWAVDGGIAAGRRAPEGFMTLTYGVQVGVSWNRWETTAPPPSGDLIFTDSLVYHRLEPRIGASAGVLVPMGSAARLRPGLTLDVDPLHLGETEDEIGMPTAWASVALTLSVELEP